MINRLFLIFFSCCFPLLTYAQDTGGTMSLAPPASDYSMVFLANLFGTVDGVLHSSGSQIMGAIFTVFNSAVLALGGIVIMYTLMVSTLNTAHEGQMLGQKWSSIWIPVRSTLGLALLIPKASGYCLMQIFVMWVIVQGVGAADKVWQAALSYLNRGGVIIQAQPDPGTDILASINGGAFAIPSGAFVMLSGQVCMLAIQKQLEAQRAMDMKPGGRCTMKPIPLGAEILCKGPVPDFLNSINFVAVQQNNNLNGNGSFSMPMPFIGFNDANSAYDRLDGICGVISWKPISGINATPTTGQTQNGLNSSELETVLLTRAIALQQMFSELSSVAQVIVDNDPQMSQNRANGANNCAISAEQQFGVPYDASGAICQSANLSDPGSNNCTTWGPSNITGCSAGSVLFNGTEFTGAITDYNGIMKPTLNLINQINNNANNNNSLGFIQNANQQGWIMAGAYFFNLVTMNTDASGTAVDDLLQDTNSGLERSMPVNIDDFSNSTKYPLFAMLQSQKSAIQVIEVLLDGIGLFYNPADPNSASKTQAPPAFTSGESLKAVVGPGSLTVYGFVNNSLMVKQPGEPGFGTQLDFDQLISFSPSTDTYQLPGQSFGCGPVTILFITLCLGGFIGDLVWNIGIFFYNIFMGFFGQMIQQIVMAFVSAPLQAITHIFRQGMDTISLPGVNPIIALANMGVMYINFSGSLWLIMLGMMIGFSFLGPFLLAILALITPLLAAWVGIMVSIGFMTAYYIPVLPYMIFTFGSIAWLISVIEAMVAAPIVALGVTHPEGHDAFGKGEAAIMLLMSVFLRPAMMIIGYITAIALCYVSVWILNAGFEQAIAFIQAPISDKGDINIAAQVNNYSNASKVNTAGANGHCAGHTGGYSDWSLDGGSCDQTTSGTGGYTGWAGVFAYFFAILTYTTMYVTVVQKSFTLISYLPDKVLRWIGGNPESLGAESAQWGDEMVKGKIEKSGKDTEDAKGKMGEQTSGYVQKAGGMAKEKLGGMLSGGSTTMGGGS